MIKISRVCTVKLVSDIHACVYSKCYLSLDTDYQANPNTFISTNSDMLRNFAWLVQF